MNKEYHPFLEMLYFAAAISFSVLLLHPVLLLISLLFGLWHMLLLGQSKKLLGILPIAILGALLNPLVNHEGMTILAYFPSGNPLTAESIWYGISAGLMLAGVLCHCVCLSCVITSDKLMYLFGTVSPSLCLVFSMSLRYVPRFLEQFKSMQNAQRLLGERDTKRTLWERVKEGIHLLSGMLTWSFENASDTADSMKARGFGLPSRTAYTTYCWQRRDLLALFALFLLISTIIIGGIKGKFSAVYFPKTAISMPSFGLLCITLLFFALPVILEEWEELQWKKYEQNT